MSVMIFDIETVPDCKIGRENFKINDELDPYSIMKAMISIHKQQQSINGNPYPSGFLPQYMHQVVAISVLIRDQDNIKVWSLGDESSSEKELIERFFTGLDKYAPVLVSWNGTGFDLPVLNHRALLHQVSSTKYWDQGFFDSNFKWNNYQNRYHQRHIDVMDSLSMHQPRANAPLNDIAMGLGFPGKMGLDGNMVMDMYAKGEIKTIRDYCETDVLNTYLTYLAFSRIRNHNSALNIEEEHLTLRSYLEQENKTHFNEFLENWNNNEKQTDQ
ncbi:MAG: 3'-5' exonuclease [Francisellaceae bacterium]|jgi:3'-5' exonuclease|nr:3'-5' exonuclease [Francisellaceae bacterium]MBT6208273.1 3'-5' exonuclease [Francisellaceae bacterium]MBT6539045.1 3'-5' exonuclease [Francisellaceae bacterium]